MTTAVKSPPRPHMHPGRWAAQEVLSGTRTLTRRDAQCQALDPDGDHRDVVLPEVTVSDAGYWFRLANWAGGVENLVVKNAAGATIGTVNRQEEGEFYVDSAGAWQLHGIYTYANA